jgi:hypothetical protein
MLIPRVRTAAQELRLASALPDLYADEDVIHNWAKPAHASSICLANPPWSPRMWWGTTLEVRATRLRHAAQSKSERKREEARSGCKHGMLLVNTKLC